MTLDILFGRNAPVGLATRQWMIFVGCIVVIFGFVIFAPLVPDAMIGNGLSIPLVGSVLGGLAHSPSRLLNHQLFVQLRGAGYSLYLLHWSLWTWMVCTAQSPKLFFSFMSR
jgi:hypothetical protein